MIGIAKAPAACGELVQGTLDGRSFHISCPIDLYSQVKVLLTGDSPEGSEKIVGASEKWKTKEAIRKTLEFFGKENLRVHFEIHSQIPLGKGMASSTADIGAACLATASALGGKIGPQEIARIALSIEPTDGTLFEGVAIFDHKNGMLSKILGKAPDMEILVVDLGGEVDTLEFNKRDFSRINQARKREIKEALRLVEEGIRDVNPALIARGATMSAFGNQKILPKPELEKVWFLARAAGAVGINVAHSGTVIGILGEAKRLDFRRLRSSLENSKIGKIFYETRIVDGGLICLTTAEI
jgi:L-threonine kinase